MEIGISNEISWDADMARRGYDVYMYDMTIDGLPYDNEKFHFFREGIAGRKIVEQSLDTLENFVARNGHTKLDLLRKINKTHTLVHLHGNNYGRALKFKNIGASLLRLS